MPQSDLSRNETEPTQNPASSNISFNNIGLPGSANTVYRDTYTVDTDFTTVPNYESYHLKEITREQFDDLFLVFLGDEQTGELLEEDFNENFDIAIGTAFGNESEVSFYVREALTYDVFQQWQAYFSDPSVTTVPLSLNLYPLPKLAYVGTGAQEFQRYDSSASSVTLNATQWELQFPHRNISLSQADDSPLIPKTHEDNSELFEHIPAEVQYAMAGIDLGMLSLLDTIEMNPFVSETDSTMAYMSATPESSPSDVQLYAVTGNQPMDNTHSSLVHEMAHLWSIRKWGHSMESPEWDEWKTAIQKDGVQTDYSDDLIEDFASSYELYEAATKSPEKNKELREQMPHRFAILDQVREEIMSIGMEEPNLFSELDALYSELPISLSVNVDKTIALCEEILALDPKQNLARETLANAIVTKIQLWDLNLADNNKAYWKETERALSICPYDSWLKHTYALHLAYEMESHGDYLALFTRVRQAEMLGGFSPYDFAWTYRSQHLLDKGIEQIEGIPHKNEETIVLLASLYAGNADLDHAARILMDHLGFKDHSDILTQDCPALRDGSVEPLLLLANILILDKKHKEAQALYLAILPRVENTDFEARDFIQNKAIGYGLSLLRSRHTDLAFDYFKIVLQADPENSAAHEHMGYIYVQREEPEKALQHFQEAILFHPDISSQHPQTTKLLSVTALTYWTVGENDRALSIAEHVLQSSPHDYFALQAQGFVYLAKGRVNDARIVFEKLQKQYPDKSRVVLGLAMSKISDEDQYLNGLDEMRALVDVHQKNPAALTSIKHQLAYALQWEHLLRSPEALDESAQILNELLTENSDDLATRLILANYHFSNGDYEKACLLSNQILNEVDVGTQIYFKAIGLLGLSLAFGDLDYARAGTYLVELHEKDLDNYAARLGLAYLALQRNKGTKPYPLTKAYSLITELYQDYPYNTRVIKLAAEICQEYGGFLNLNGDFEQAREVLAEAEYYQRQIS